MKWQQANRIMDMKKMQQHQDARSKVHMPDTIKRSSWQKLAYCIVMLAILMPWFSLAAKAEQVAAPAVNMPARAMPPRGVKKGTRQLKIIQPKLSLSGSPADKEFYLARVFTEPLIPLNDRKIPAEDKALAQALTAYHAKAFTTNSAGKSGARKKGQGNRQQVKLPASNALDLTALEKFLAEHPQSRWAPSLQLNLGLLQFQQGYFSKALGSWQQVWDAASGETQEPQAHIANRALAELLTLHCRLGNITQLEQLLPYAEKRQMDGSLAAKVDSARKGIACMKDDPATSFKCGPYAVYNVYQAMNKEKEAKLPEKKEALDKEASSKRGTSFEQLLKFGNKLGLNLLAVKRSDAGEFVVPSIVHWKLGHYAAITDFKDGKYRISDPTFGNNGHLWVTRKVLEAESDGLFLIPGGNVPEGWRSLSAAETKNIWGKGVSADDWDQNQKTSAAPKQCMGTDCGDCGGMPRASAFSMQASLNIVDTPLAYVPPLGPDIGFTINYTDQEPNQPAVFSFPNLGPNWSFNWVSYLTVDISQNVLVRVRGGGSEQYLYTGDAGNPYYPDMLSQALIVPTGAGTYERHLADGSIEVYNQPDGSGRVFLTEVIDPQGNSVLIQYDEDFRVTTITDAIGQASAITYVSNTGGTPGFFRIAQITDPFSRSCSFTYDASNNNLSSVTDSIGLVSRFTYNPANSFITNMITPYGTTGFYKYLPGNFAYARGLRMTFPDGSTSVLENWIGHLTSYTYFWDREVLHRYPTDPEDGNHADHCKTTMWMVKDPLPYTEIAVPKSVKMPLDFEVVMTYANEVIIRVFPVLNPGPGNINKPITVRQSGMPPASFQYNALGKVTQSIDQVGRKFSYTYDTNNIDLTEIRETKDTDNYLIGKWEYNEHHQPTLQIDGSGQQTHFTYNERQQLATVTDANGGVTTRTYDEDGYLIETDGPLSGNQDKSTFTYDGYGRLYTVTTSTGYTVAFSYDAMDRLTLVTYPDGTTEQYLYSRLDNAMVKDRNNRWSTMTYDKMQQLTFTVDPLGRKSSYQWCSCGSVKKLTDPAGNITTWNHDIQGRITQKKYANNTTLDLTYDNYGRLQTRTDALNQVATYSYNVDNTLSGIAYTNSVHATPNVSLTYDQKFPRLLTATNSWGTVTQAYNNYITDPEGTPITGGGMLASITNNVIANSDIAFTYDALGRLTNRTINTSANSTTWTYDAISRITQEVNELGTFTFSYLNNTPGSSKGDPRLASITYPNSQVTTFDYYDNTGDQRLKEIKNMNSSSGVLSQFNYEYNPAGEITLWQQQQNGRNIFQRLSYDKAGQLIAAQSGAGKTGPPYAEDIKYCYDEASNRVSVQSSAIDTARITGTITADDVLTITVIDPSLSGGQKSINYTVQSGDTIASVASKLSAAITADTDLQALGVNAVPVSPTSTSTVALLLLRSVSHNVTTYTKSTSGGATESIAFNQPLNGSSDVLLSGTVTEGDTVTVTVHDYGLGGGEKSKTYTVQSGDTLDDIATGLATAINSDVDLQGIYVEASTLGSTVNISSLSTNATTYTVSTSEGATEKAVVEPNVNGIQTAVIAGSKTTDDEISISVYDAGLSGGSQTVSYTVQSGDNLAAIATGIAGVINGSNLLTAIGITASVEGTVVKLSSKSQNLTTYSYSLSGGATETVALSTSLSVTKSAYNNVNELTGISAGGLTRFEGTTNLAVKSVSINTVPARLESTRNYVGEAMLNAGNNTVEIEAIDGADHSKTNTYKLSIKGAPNQSLTYDANGNTTSNGIDTYQWDAENRLIQTIRPGAGNYTEFVYDALGHRVKELEYVSSSLTSTKQNIWDGSARACEQRDASGNVLKLCYSLGEKVGGVTKLHGLDHLGSVRDVVGSGETVEAHYSYSPFGQQVVLQGAANASTFGYAGMYVHAPTSLNLTPYRVYDSNIGRWLSRDPMGENAGMNLYAYVGNMPILLLDPLGLQPYDNIYNAGISGARNSSRMTNMTGGPEFGGSIYQSQSGSYHITPSVMGIEGFFNPSSTYGLIPFGLPIVGDFHSHPNSLGHGPCSKPILEPVPQQELGAYFTPHGGLVAPSRNPTGNKFSGFDLQGARQAGYHTFVGIPDGGVLYFSGPAYTYQGEINVTAEPASPEGIRLK